MAHGTQDRDGERGRPPSLRWLYSFADPERGVGWNPRAAGDERWRLGRTRALLDLAGSPDRAMRCVLIAGTKGKGSTAAFLASLLHAGHVRAGLYTQPHLQTYRERIRVEGEAIGEDALASAVRRWRPVVEELRRRHPDAGEPTTFEITTALAIDHFARSGCGVAVLEVGLGGRLDATNAVDPEISILATIDRGHTDILGRRIEQIAREKAGIMRRGRVALLARQRPAVRRELLGACRREGALCRSVDPLPADVAIALPGAHQRQNAALAVEAARELGVAPSLEALARMSWPARFEIVAAAPLIVVDGAHDPVSARALADELGRRGVRDVDLVIGMYRDKEAARVLRPLMPLTARAWVTSPGGARALPAKDLARVARRLGMRVEGAYERPADAIDAARSTARALVVAGSLALAGRAREHLGLAPAERLW